MRRLGIGGALAALGYLLGGIASFVLGYLLGNVFYLLAMPARILEIVRVRRMPDQQGSANVTVVD